MTVSDFWHSAFLSALARLPAQEAKIEADLSLKIAAEHWQQVLRKKGRVVPSNWIPYAQLDITNIDEQQTV